MFGKEGEKMNNLFPSPLEAWVVSYLGAGGKRKWEKQFPSPLEGWVISYKMKKTIKLGLTDRHAFPSLLEVWVVSYDPDSYEMIVSYLVSVPSRGMSGFL